MRLIILLSFFLLNVHFVFAGQKDSLQLLVENEIDKNNPLLPPVDQLYIKNINDISICKGPNHTYYLTGTTGDRDGVQEGIQVWASRDLKSWNLIGANKGYVWTFRDDAVEWQKKISKRNGWTQRGLIAPEIHYLHNNFWITYSNSNSNKLGILRSVNGRGQGPYEEVWNDSMYVKGSNASLFVDSDSTVYFIWDGRYIQPLKEDMSGFATLKPFLLQDTQGKPIGGDEVYLSKIDGRYVLMGGQWNGYQNHSDVSSRYDGIIAVSDHLYGPYVRQEASIPHGGGGHLFESFDDRLWWCFSGVDVSGPVSSSPAIIPVVNYKGEFLVKHELGMHPGKFSGIVYVSKEGNNSTGSSWRNAFTTVQRAVDFAPRGSQIWIARGNYNESVEISLRNGIYLYGGFKGDEKLLAERNIDTNKVVINGQNKIRQVMTILSSNYIRIDGLSIVGGNATSGISYQYYGAGMYIIGGGETVRIVNCEFRNNVSEQDGGGLYVSIGSAPMLINCIFKDNVSKRNGGAAALYSNNTNGYHTKFYNCTFENNFAYNAGGALYFDTNKRDLGLLTLVNCLIIRNRSIMECGAISLDRSSRLFMMNSTLCYNEGSSKGASIGSFGNAPAQSRVVNSVFFRNEGGMLFCIDGEGEAVQTKDTLYYKSILAQFSDCFFGENQVESLVQRNFDRKKWISVNDLNQSVLGQNCVELNPLSKFNPMNRQFYPGVPSGTYSFGYTIAGEKRAEGKRYVGCY
jgi:predicted outer membrane repeat protein